MVSELVEFKDHLPIHALSLKSVGREGVYWEKTIINLQAGFVMMSWVRPSISTIYLNDD